VTLSRTTLRGSPLVLAPGKVFLVGEYAVLDEGVAVLAAVSRHAIGQYMPDLTAASPVITETVRRALTALGDLADALPRGAPWVDTSAFEQDGVKLGLGSSAAAAVAATGALFEHVGISLEANKELLYSIADAGHRAAQGGVGSGADVAAAVHGGFLEFFRPRDGVPAVSRLTPPATLEIVVFWSGQAARTADLVQAVGRFATREAAAHARRIDELRGVSRRFVTAFTSNDARGAVAAAEAYGKGLEDLGAAARTPIVTPPFQRAAALARTLGGAAKPSGAGGGDVGVAFFAHSDAAAEFAARCPEGILVLDIRLGATGAHRRLPSGIETFKKD
jgi:phosphomevalonate kinase